MKKAIIPSIRNTYFLLALFSAFLVGIAIFLQIELGLVPCPLCILQRLLIIVLGVFSLVAALHNPLSRGTLIYTVLITLIAIAGFAVSGHHVLLQYYAHASEVQSCGMGLTEILRLIPPSEWVHVLLESGESCQKVQWIFHNLSLVEWTLIAFGTYVIVLLIQLLRCLRAIRNRHP